MRTLTLALAAGLSLVAAAKAERIKALKKVAYEETRTIFSTWVPGFRKYYVEGESDAASAERQERFLAALRELMAIDPTDAYTHCEYAEALLYKGDVKAAEAEYRKAKELYNALPKGTYAAKLNDLARTMYGLANCRFAAGDREGALAELKAVVALPPYWVRRFERNWKEEYAAIAIPFLEGNLLDGLHLPRHTGSRVFPEAHQAEYSETFTPLKKVTVKGLDSDDLRYELLKCKLAARGVEVERAGIVSTLLGTSDFLLEIVGDAPEAEFKGARTTDEAYRLEVGEKGAKVTACTKIGVTWGVVSFIQLLAEGKPAVRQAKILDWSDLRERGGMSLFWPHEIEFALFFRINSLDAQFHPTMDNCFMPISCFVEEEQGRIFTGFGLKYYFGIAWATMQPQLPLCRERTLKFHEKICKFHAKSGAGVYFPFDDARFNESTKSGMTPLDDKAYGCAANIDGKYLTKLYRAVKAEYPNFYMVFCPPFYWGPDSPASYPEDRENYLKSLGETLDPEIDIYWTGPKVKSYELNKRQVDWITKLTGRKPFYSQNALGQHNLYNYIVDTIPLDTWYYDTIVDDLAGFNVNGMSCQLEMQSLPAAYFWNRKAYDREGTMRRAIQQLLGEKMPDILKPGRDALTYFDRYKYGQPNAAIIHEKPDDLKAKLDLASNCWARALAYCPLVKSFGFYGAAIGFAANVYKTSLNPPDFIAQNKAEIEATEAIAKSEAGCDKSKGDILITPIGLAGPSFTTYAHPKKTRNAATGRYEPVPGGGLLPKRFISTLRGAQSVTPSVRFSFECDPFPPAGDYTLAISALKDETTDPIRVCVRVNGEAVAENLDPGFDHIDYKVKTVTIPSRSMKRHNTVEIAVMNPGTNMNGAPWLAINYVIVRKTEKK